jgi:uncharacterized protein
MVSEAMAKLVFLSMPVGSQLFPLRKANPFLFFKVKQIFLKIKSGPGKTGPIKQGGSTFDMKTIDVMAAALVIIGALNWGLVGLFRFDLVAAVFGMGFGETSGLSSAVYGLVGLSGLYQAAMWKSIQRRWHTIEAHAHA